MLLRSSSTPILGSLISSVAESPNPNHHHHLDLQLHTQSPSTNGSSKLSCTNGRSQSFRSSKSIMSSPSVDQIPPKTGFLRRVQSEGNLEELDSDDFGFSKRLKPKLEASLEVDDSDEEDEEDDYVVDKEEEEGDNCGGDGDSFRFENFVSDEDMRNNVLNGLGFQSEGKMYLATGFGISGLGYVDVCGNSGGGNGGGGGYRPLGFNRGGGGGGDNNGVNTEEHYRTMLQSNPGNPLFLRNYAQFLYQTKGDLVRAEEYYSRAILADPEDGDALAQYAKLIWELHQDKERALNYFERAIRASSHDSYVHAAYASFLWDIEDDEDEEEENSMPQFYHGMMASASA